MLFLVSLLLLKSLIWLGSLLFFSTYAVLILVFLRSWRLICWASLLFSSFMLLCGIAVDTGANATGINAVSVVDASGKIATGFVG